LIYSSHQIVIHSQPVALNFSLSGCLLIPVTIGGVFSINGFSILQQSILLDQTTEREPIRE
jgi:hypothetical protein